MKLIDADKMIKELRYAAGLIGGIHDDMLGAESPFREEIGRLKGFSQEIINGTIKYLEQQPGVDAVEVVRCKDCKHYVEESEVPDWCGIINMEACVEPDDFCSYGTRKEAEQ